MDWITRGERAPQLTPRSSIEEDVNNALPPDCVNCVLAALICVDTRVALEKFGLGEDATYYIAELDDCALRRSAVRGLLDHTRCGGSTCPRTMNTYADAAADTGVFHVLDKCRSPI